MMIHTFFISFNIVFVDCFFFFFLIIINYYVWFSSLCLNGGTVRDISNNVADHFVNEDVANTSSCFFLSLPPYTSLLPPYISPPP